MAVTRLVTGSLEHRLIELNRRHGTRGVVGVITAVSLFLAESLTALSCAATATPPQFVVLALLIAGVVTLAVAPLSSYLIARLLQDLTTAHHELSALAHRDPLTGLHNRRAFFAEATERLAGAVDGRQHVAAMIDLDHFKQLNDTHGHAAGDAALVELGRRLSGAVGADGIVARLGGDEFAVLLGVASDEAAGRIAALAHACRDVTALPGVTVDGSLGTAAVPVGMGLDDALQRADLALYRAKARRGASRV